MDTVNKEFSPLTEATGALMDKLDKRIIIAIIVIILIIIAEFVTHGAPSYEIPESPTEGTESLQELSFAETVDYTKKEEKPVVEAVKKPESKPAPAPTPPSGDWVTRCKRWAEMAGVPLNSWAIELIGRESSCNPTVWNYGGSGAGGIPQALPASKMGCAMNWSDEAAICQLRWMENYVFARYGSWQNAVYFHNSHNWY